MKNKCKDCLNKKIECELCGKFFSKKRLRSHYEREHQPKIDIVNERITLTEKQSKTTTLLFQQMKITPMLLLVQKTLARLITC